MKRFRASIKEKNNSVILHPSWITEDSSTIQDAEDFWGCHDDDIEWFKIEEEWL